MTLITRLNRAHYEGVTRYDMYVKQNSIANTVEDVVSKLSGESIIEKRVTPFNVFYGAYIGAPAQYMLGFCAELFSRRR
jgi:hypothetical protein